MCLATTRSQERRFEWAMTQGTVDLLAAVLRRAETVFRDVDPFCMPAEHAAYLLAEMREQTRLAGAQDSYPFLPMRCQHPEEDVAA